MKEAKARGDAGSSCKLSTQPPTPHTQHTHTHTPRKTQLRGHCQPQAKAEQSLKRQRRSASLCSRTFLCKRDLVCHCGVFSSHDYLTGIAPFSLAGYTHSWCTLGWAHKCVHTETLWSSVGRMKQTSTGPAAHSVFTLPLITHRYR